MMIDGQEISNEFKRKKLKDFYKLQHRSSSRCTDATRYHNDRNQRYGIYISIIYSRLMQVQLIITVPKLMLCKPV